MSKPSFKEKLKYSFENTLSSGPIAIVGWLGLVSLLIVVVAGTIIALFNIPSEDGGEESWGFVEGVWNSLMRTFDAGNMADDSGWGLRAVSISVTIGGIFIVATLIGTITSGMEAAIEEMRKGRSRVLESNHTLILGWSPKIFTIISELLIANENKKNPRIVIMADQDKVEMEDEIRSKFPNTKNTKIICRTGSPLDLDDLKVASPNDAKSIIILSPEDTDQPDTYVIKSILALTNNPERKQEPFHIVAEFREEKNIEAGELVGNGEAKLILSSDLISRVTAQTCRQSGLSVVYTELMDFDGAEIYFGADPKLTGKPYREIIQSYEDSTVMGVINAEGTVIVNPPMDYKFQQGDQVIAITENSDSMIMSNKPAPAPDLSAVRMGERVPAGKERTLILGWNEKGPAIIRELDNYVGFGSDVLVVSDDEESEGQVAELSTSLERQTIVHKRGNFTEKAMIVSIRPEDFDHIILLCYNHLPIQEADAMSLITLLHLRNLSEQSGKDMSIVSEMRDIRNRALAEIAKADDFIVSDKLVSLLLSQVSENKDLDKVFKHLFESDGSEIYIRPIKDYIEPGKAVNFYTLIEAASQRAETAIGYRIVANSSNPDKAYGVNCNPVKSETITFAENDCIIVLAED